MQNSTILNYSFQNTTKHGAQSNQKQTENILVITFKKSTLQLPAYRLQVNFSIFQETMLNQTNKNKQAA